MSSTTTAAAHTRKSYRKSLSSFVTQMLNTPIADPESMTVPKEIPLKTFSTIEGTPFEFHPESPNTPRRHSRQSSLFSIESISSSASSIITSDDVSEFL